MTIITRIGGTARPVFGYPVNGAVGVHAWRVRPFPGAESALSGLTVTGAPMTKSPHVSASERCP